ncbi:hypothetical protein CRENBAI_005475 [Crenichthys baileyi]|uniref:Uncharacterized protein n=1 Tax=Crenichthys baileyi TaxID=28760 RepID=A0AAV9S7E3_9TELE
MLVTTHQKRGPPCFTPDPPTTTTTSHPPPRSPNHPASASASSPNPPAPPITMFRQRRETQAHSPSTRLGHRKATARTAKRLHPSQDTEPTSRPPHILPHIRRDMVKTNNPKNTPPTWNHPADKQTPPKYKAEKPDATAKPSDARPASHMTPRAAPHRTTTPPPQHAI